MTVRQNMAFALKIAKEDDATINKKVEEAAEILDLKAHLDRKPANLSGGQRQRVAMGRVIVRDPSAFLMDEPLSNLDAKLRVQMRTEVSRLQKKLGTTTVYVTHDQVEAMTLGDRVAVMSGGALQQVGPPQELYDSPSNLFVAGFIGSPSMNFLPGTIESGTIKTPLGDIQLLEDAELVGDKRDQGHVIEAEIDVLESLGSDKFVYFTVQGDRAVAKQLEEIARDAGAEDRASGDGIQVTARLDAASKAAEDSKLDIWIDLSKLHVFDPDSGKNLTL
jgi:multiple sugar transport system ATP-binding protein